MAIFTVSYPQLFCKPTDCHVTPCATGDTTVDALQWTRNWLGPDLPFANISAAFKHVKAPAVTSYTGPHFSLLKSAIQQVWGSDLPVLPNLMSGGTDSKHYSELTTAILRFCPVSYNQGDEHRVHGTNERISVEDFGKLLCTYKAGLKLAAAERAGEERGGGLMGTGPGLVYVSKAAAVVHAGVDSSRMAGCRANW